MHNHAFVIALLFVPGAVIGTVLGKLLPRCMHGWRQYREQRRCFHHSFDSAGHVASFIRSRLIDLGRGKMFWCVKCGKRWFV